MSGFTPRLDEQNFTLNHVADLESVSKLNGYQHADPATVAVILDEAARFFTEVIAPLNRVGDEQGSILEDDGVVTPDGFKEAYAKWTEAGWSAAGMPEEWGGGGLPYVVAVAIDEMFRSSNLAFSLAGMLTHGSIHALVAHGSDELNSTYVEKLVSGQWAGTMNLTEADAGSDLGAIRSKAVLQDDGSYLIFGTKVFITWGDQDLTENIIHLVLARTPDAPPGTRGISMFVVPKFLPDENGNPGDRNDIKVVSIEHKLGIHASPTCVISFGDAGEGAVGYLVGNEMDGMRNMFTMMNAARIGVGMEGMAVSEAAFQKASTYAHERLQGRAVGSSSKDSVAIVEHADVRRMLLTMKANTEAMRSLLYFTAQEGDFAKHSEDEERARSAKDRLALLTPVVKAWCTDLGVEMASIGLQVHGGMGYVEETGAAQYLRDVRITPIYEGTNGIQAMDLVARKLTLESGAVLSRFITEMTDVLKYMNDYDDLGDFRDELTTAIQGLADTSTWLGEQLAAGNIEDALAGASPYMTQFGTVIGGWLMAKAAVAAKSEPAEFDADFLTDKVTTARFYGEHLLPQANGLIPTVKGGAGLLKKATL
ncbi:MAG: acyl-CoA dehydrogenase [Actinomycetota bacterium]|nr:acyl-CoA dehydrogenase [Actinomycetota bacterium]